MRKGLFLSRHHGKISDVVDVDGLADRFDGLTTVRVYDQFYEPAHLRDMLLCAKEHRLDAVVLAGPSAALMETSRVDKSLTDAFKLQGVNPNRIAFANLLDHVAMPHADQPDQATAKARLLIDVALAKVDHCQNVATVAVRPQRSVLVLGTTAEGLAAADALLQKKYAVTVVERLPNWRDDDGSLESDSRQRSRIQGNPNARVLLDADLADLSGWSGDYRVTLKTTAGDRQVAVGAILLCIGDDRQWIARLQPKLRLETDDAGHLMNRSGNRSNGETREAGIWFIPAAASLAKPKLQHTVLQTAVQALSELLDKPRIEHPMLVSEVDASRCGGCGTCIKTCAFAASGIDAVRKLSIIDVQRCRGCGNCVTACPTSARDLVTFPTAYVNRAIEILSRGVPGQGDPKILAFMCRNSGDPAAASAGKESPESCGGGLSPNILPLPVACGGNIDTTYILKAFKEGFDGVALVVCKDRHCHNLVGNTDMERRIGLLRAVLRSRRMDDNRMRIIHTCGHEGRRLNAELTAFSRELKGR